VGARLAAHGHAHQVEPVSLNGGVLFDVRHGISRINLRLGGDWVGEIYDTNYLHRKKLLPESQFGNSIPVSNAVSR